MILKIGRGEGVARLLRRGAKLAGEMGEAIDRLKIVPGRPRKFFMIRPIYLTVAFVVLFGRGAGASEEALPVDLRAYFVLPAEWATRVGSYPSALTFAGGWRVRDAADWQLVDTKFQPIGTSKWGRAGVIGEAEDNHFRAAGPGERWGAAPH